MDGLNTVFFCSSMNDFEKTSKKFCPNCSYKSTITNYSSKFCKIYKIDGKSIRQTRIFGTNKNTIFVKFFLLQINQKKNKLRHIYY